MMMLVAQPDQTGFDPDKGERLAFVLRKVDAKVGSHCRHHW
jgi:hypothetical protein